MKIRTDHTLFKSREKITQRIASFWDQISQAWRQVSGRHIHHGYYDGEAGVSHQEAQHKLMEKLADFAEIQPHIRILDAGCGLGGSSFYLAERYAARVFGVTLSPKQAAIATEEARKKNLSNPRFEIEDTLSLKSFAAHSFDLVWSLESCEQFFDKQLFLQQAFRVLKPGGKLMLATWCSSEDEYKGRQARKYKKLCQAFDLPYMPSMEHYSKILAEQGFKISKQVEWSRHVQPSWEQGIDLAKAYSFMKLISMAGWRGFRFVGQLRRMKEGFENGTVKYGVFCAEKSV
jgi:tocopherol O-methyltransferase